MKSMTMIFFLGLALLAVGQGEVALADYDHCYTYTNSRLVSSWEYGTYCGATGSGCVNCWNDNGGSYCIGALPSGCSIDHQNW